MPHGVSIEEYAVPDRDSGPYAITTGSDGALGFTMVNANRIGRMDPTGGVTSYPTAGSEPHGITIGPDGAAWAALEIGVIARCATT
jgi:virginiamycin B lyase